MPEKFGSFSVPKEDKRRPLTPKDERKFYQTACEMPNRETELAGRVLLDYGLRVSELGHIRAPWVRKQYHPEKKREFWQIAVPKFEHCWGGKGSKSSYKNEEGLNLHETSEECGKCQDRNWLNKVRPKNSKGERRPEDGWLTEEQAKEHGWHPKSERSASEVWQLGALEETEETAELLKKFLEGQKHEQWPHLQGSIRTRVQKIADRADLDLPKRPPGVGVVPHALRHTYGCRLVEAGLSEGVGMNQMRHRNSDVFQWYGELRSVRTINALDRAFTEDLSLLEDLE